LIATGTRAGAVDADFSNETCLELWDPALDRQGPGADLQPTAKISTDSGYAARYAVNTWWLGLLIEIFN
jgi:protein transport protein SEC31